MIARGSAPPRARAEERHQEPVIFLVEVCRQEGGAGATYSLQYSVSANLLIDPVRPLSGMANNLADVCSRRDVRTWRENGHSVASVRQRGRLNVVD